MSRQAILLAISIAGALVALVAEVAGTPAPVPDLVALAVAVVVAEQFELCPRGRAPLPLSFAVVVVLIQASTPKEFVVTIGAAFAVAVSLRGSPTGAADRGLLYVQRLVEALGALAAFRLVMDAADVTVETAIVLTALAAAAIAEVAIADLVTLASAHRFAPLGARGADLAIVTSGMLMAVGYAGIEGVGALGLWGPLLFSIPLLAAWYSFQLLASTRRNLHQTLKALGAAPEFAGLVRAGHVERVARLAVEIGHELSLPETEIEQLETAALLHHLGAVCLDAPPDGAQLDPVAVAEAGASMLRANEVLARAGDIVEAEPALHRAPGAVGTEGSLASQILKIASAFDELTHGQDEHAAWAIEALYTGPLYVYDGRVVGALERVLERREVIGSRH